MKMLGYKLILMTVVLCVGFACGHHGGHGGGGNHHEKWEKIKRCMNETKDLSAECCPMPKPQTETLKDDEDCKHHLEGMESEGRGRHKAWTCFNECIFKKHGLFEDGQFTERTKIKESFETYLKKNNGDDFIDITMTSLDYCMDKFAEKIEQMNEVAEKWKKSHAENAENAENNADSTSKRRERCHWLPSALIGCVQGNIARNCPETHWQTTDDCKAKKANATPMDDCM